jgi:putative hemolysin
VKGLGFYSAQEFDFTPFQSVFGEMVELGRACVHHEHRKMHVVNLLWRGIADYARERGAHYLIGCSSLTSQDPAVGWGTYAQMTEHLVPECFRTEPLQDWRMELTEPMADCPKPPRLLRAYLSIGAKICGPPALDRNFKTIDFLTLLDLRTMPVAVQNHYNV